MIIMMAMMTMITMVTMITMMTMEHSCHTNARASIHTRSCYDTGNATNSDGNAVALSPASAFSALVNV